MPLDADVTTQIHEILKHYTDKNILFTSVDVNNELRRRNIFVKNQEISTEIKEWFTFSVTNYKTSVIDVQVNIGGTITTRQAILYHPKNTDPIEYERDSQKVLWKDDKNVLSVVKLLSDKLLLETYTSVNGANRRYEFVQLFKLVPKLSTEKEKLASVLHLMLEYGYNWYFEELEGVDQDIIDAASTAFYGTIASIRSHPIAKSIKIKYLENIFEPYVKFDRIPLSDIDLVNKLEELNQLKKK